MPSFPTACNDKITCQPGSNRTTGGMAKGTSRSKQSRLHCFCHVPAEPYTCMQVQATKDCWTVVLAARLFLMGFPSSILT